MPCEDMGPGCIYHLAGIYAAQMQAVAFMQPQIGYAGGIPACVLGGYACLEHLRAFTQLCGESSVFQEIIYRGLCYNRGVQARGREVAYREGSNDMNRVM